MNEIQIGDKTYISSKRAAEITGYAKDYVGQLCREGHVEAKMVGRSWYVFEPSIRAHRFGEVPSQESTESEAQDEVQKSNNAESVEDINPAVEATQTWEKPSYTPEEPNFLPELDPTQDNALTDMQKAWKEWFSLKQEHKIEENSEQSSEENAQIESTDMKDEEEESFEDEQESLEEGAEAILFTKIEEPEMDEEVDDQEDETNEESYEASEEASESVSVPLRKVYQEEYPSTIQHVSHESAEMVPIRRNVSVTPSTAAYAAPQEGNVLYERIVRPSSKRASKAYRSNSGKQSQRSSALVISMLVAISLLAVVIGVIGSGIADSYIKTFGANNAIVNFLVGNSTYSSK